MADFTIEATLAPDDVRKLALWCVTRIRERSRRGEGPRGKLKPYSTAPFARPLSGITHTTRKNLGDDLRIFTSKNETLWAVITSGYEGFKRAAYPGRPEKVDLTGTGAMLGALTVVRASDTGFIIGFTRQEEAEKAGYVEDQGREFLDLSAQDEDDLRALVAQYVQVK